HGGRDDYTGTTSVLRLGSWCRRFEVRTLQNRDPMSIVTSRCLGETTVALDQETVKSEPPVVAPVPRAAAPPSAASNSRSPMVTVIRPSRTRCSNGRIPRHQRPVLTARAPGAGGPPEVVRSPPFDNLLVDGMSARGAKPTRLECHNRVSIGA